MTDLTTIKNLIKQAHIEAVAFRKSNLEPSGMYAEDALFIVDVSHEIFKELIDFSDRCHREPEIEGAEPVIPAQQKSLEDLI